MVNLVVQSFKTKVMEDNNKNHDQDPIPENMEPNQSPNPIPQKDQNNQQGNWDEREIVEKSTKQNRPEFERSNLNPDREKRTGSNLNPDRNSGER